MIDRLCVAVLERQNEVALLLEATQKVLRRINLGDTGGTLAIKLLQDSETVVEADVGDKVARSLLLLKLVECRREVHELLVVDQLGQAVLLGELDDLLVRWHLRRKDASILLGRRVDGSSLLGGNLLRLRRLHLGRHS